MLASSARAWEESIEGEWGEGGDRVQTAGWEGGRARWVRGQPSGGVLPSGKLLLLLPAGWARSRMQAWGGPRVPARRGEARAGADWLQGGPAARATKAARISTSRRKTTSTGRTEKETAEGSERAESSRRLWESTSRDSTLTSSA